MTPSIPQSTGQTSREDRYGLCPHWTALPSMPRVHPSPVTAAVCPSLSPSPHWAGSAQPGTWSLLAGVSQAEAREPGKAPHFSVNWVVGTADVEVIDATTGRRSCGRSSRLCKHRLSARWARLYGKVGAAPSQRLRAGGGGGHRWGQVTANTPTGPPGTPDVTPPSRSPTRSRLVLWPQKQMERDSVVNGCGRPSL